MRGFAVYLCAALTGVFVFECTQRACAQEVGNIEDRIPLLDAQISGTDSDLEEAPEAPLHSRQSGLINVSIPPSEIDKRLPQEASPEKGAEDKLKLPPPPALRERPTSRFVLTAVEIHGVTAYPLERFAPLYDNLLARSVSVADVAKLTEAITAAYRADGYFLSRATAPAQAADNGLLVIEVFEGYIANVSVKGGDGDIRKRLSRLTNERPLKLTTLERSLALIEDLRGISVQSTEIVPDTVDFARHQLNVEVKADLFEASVYSDNRGTDAAGPLQLYARGAANSLLRTGDQLSVGVFSTPSDPNELLLAELSYHFPLLPSGTYATVSGMASKYEAGASLATLDAQTQTKRLSISLSHPLIRQRKLSLWANIGFEGRNIDEEQLGLPSYEDKLRVISAWTNFRHEHWNGYTTAFGKISRGLDMIGATSGGASLSRPDANGEFTKFEAQISRYQNIGKMFGAYVSLDGQYSLNPLLASEEFSLGGARFGRAYDYGELTGDDGVAALVEVRYGRDPNLGFLDFYQFYGFYDYGVVWNHNAAPGFDELSLSSAGGGLRLAFPNSIAASIEIAKPLEATPFTGAEDNWRGFFSIAKSF